MSGISENEDGSINIDITDEEWDAWVAEQEEFRAKFYETYNKAVKIAENGGSHEDIIAVMLDEEPEKK